MILPAEHTFRKLDELLCELVLLRKNPLLLFAVRNEVMSGGTSTIKCWISSENRLRAHDFINRLARRPETACESC